MADDTTRRFTLAATVLGSSLAFVDATVVTVALPAIQSDLELGLSGQEWVYLSYSLALAALYLPAGAIGDRWGRRSVFVYGALAFAAASALAGAAPNGEVLIAARFPQGVAGAFVTTNSLALLRSAYGEDAGRAVGLWTAFTSVATVIGPPAGGALVEWASWRWIFFLNLPLVAATVVLARLGRAADRPSDEPRPLDVAGSVLAALAFGALTYSMVEGSEQGFGQVWWGFALAAASLVAFVFVERWIEMPLLPFDLFRRRNFSVANAETFLVYGSISGLFLFLPIYLQFLGFTPFEAGLFSVPPSIVLILLAARFGGLADRHGPRAFLTLGPAAFGVGILLLVPISSRGEFWVWGVAALLFLSVGLAMLVAPITATSIASAPEQFAGIASGVNTTLSRLGGLLAVAVIGLVISLVFEANGGTESAVPLAVGQVDPELRDASVSAFRAGALVAAALAFGGAALAAIGISNADARSAVERAPDELAPAES